MFIPHYPATSTYFPPLSRFSLNIIRSGKVKEVKGAGVHWRWWILALTQASACHFLTPNATPKKRSGWLCSSWADFEAHFNEEWYVGIAAAAEAAIFHTPNRLTDPNLTTSTDSFRGFARSHCRSWRATTSTTSFPVQQKLKNIKKELEHTNRRKMKICIKIMSLLCLRFEWHFCMPHGK